MGSCFGKQNHKSIVKLTCPYCRNFESYNIKEYDKHIIYCIDLKKDFTDKNIIFCADISQKRWPNKRLAMSNITEII